ncbi:cyclin-like protein [Kalaharituber pfeilii]|nr:cyclin-like protein [Kalaharituber pfeilii]
MVRSRQTACCSNPTLDDSDGQTVCTNCGSVINETHIVSEITFGEASSGAAIVQGSFVGAGETHARNTGPFRKGGGLESREQTLANAKRKIQQLAAALSVPESYTEAAGRWFTLALTNGFTHGRRTQYVIACCLYAVCRQEKSSHMLIDFSDILHINVFTLGQTYLKLVRLLHIPTTTIDPSVYIHRFAKHLEFGKDTMKVASDATRLVSRMNRDWIVQGRRPSGICGACLLLAARMNNYRRSVREVVYVVKVADLTIQKRLEEFKLTKSSSLTVDEFRNLWLEQAHDPPSFGPKISKKRKRVREVNEDGDVAGDGPIAIAEKSGDKVASVIVSAEAGVEDTPPASVRVSSEPRRDAEGFVIPELPIDPALFMEENSTGAAAASGLPNTPPPTQPAADTEDPGERINAIAEAAIESEIQNIVSSADSTSAVTSLSIDKDKAKSEADLARRERARRSQSVASNVSGQGGSEAEDIDGNALSILEGDGNFVDSADPGNDSDDLADVDDWEVQSALLTAAETEVKERIWTELNKEYIKEQQAKKLKAERDARNGVGKNTRKKRNGGKGGKKGPGRTGGGAGREIAASPAESAKEMLAKRTYSKKINYAALDHLFKED